MADKRFLQRREPTFLSESFDGGDLVALVHDGQRKTRIDPATVHEDRARAALAMITPFLTPGQTERFTEEVKQRRSRFDLDGVRLTIYL